MREPHLTAIRVEGECLVAIDTQEVGPAIQETIQYAKWKGEPVDLVVGKVRLHIHGDSLFDTIVGEWNRQRVPEPYYQ